MDRTPLDASSLPGVRLLNTRGPPRKTRPRKILRGGGDPSKGTSQAPVQEAFNDSSGNSCWLAPPCCTPWAGDLRSPRRPRSDERFPVRPPAIPPAHPLTTPRTPPAGFHIPHIVARLTKQTKAKWSEAAPKTRVPSMLSILKMHQLPEPPSGSTSGTLTLEATRDLRRRQKEAKATARLLEEQLYYTILYHIIL